MHALAPLPTMTSSARDARVVPSGSVQLYVYYRVTHVEGALRAVAEAQRTLCTAEPGLIVGLLERTDSEGASTLLETYAHERGLDATHEMLIAAMVEPVLASWLDGTRRVERFTRRT